MTRLITNEVTIMKKLERGWWAKCRNRASRIDSAGPGVDFIIRNLNESEIMPLKLRTKY